METVEQMNGSNQRALVKQLNQSIIAGAKRFIEVVKRLRLLDQLAKAIQNENILRYDDLAIAIAIEYLELIGNQPPIENYDIINRLLVAFSRIAEIRRGRPQYPTG
jgi:hypothetical protein